MTEPLFRDDPYLTACEARVIAVRGDTVELDRTLFYPMAGGQPGDTGRIGGFRVLDTRRGEAPDSILHVMEPGFDLPVDRRYRHMRFHTALHLLCAAVKAPVTGGRMAADKAHLDFDIEMERLQKEIIEARVNEMGKAAIETRAHWISDAELDSRPELVKTMSVAPPRGESRDLQACGGNTAEIGTVEVARIRSEGKRNKRVTLVLS